MRYEKRYDTFLKKWILERIDEQQNVYYVASYPDEDMISKVVNVLNERRIDVA